jgi:hypothetical protein
LGKSMEDQRPRVCTINSGLSNANLITSVCRCLSVATAKTLVITDASYQASISRRYYCYHQPVPGDNHQPMPGDNNPQVVSQRIELSRIPEDDEEKEKKIQ